MQYVERRHHRQGNERQCTACPTDSKRPQHAPDGHGQGAAESAAEEGIPCEDTSHVPRVRLTQVVQNGLEGQMESRGKESSSEDRHDPVNAITWHTAKLVTIICVSLCEIRRRTSDEKPIRRLKDRLGYRWLQLLRERCVLRARLLFRVAFAWPFWVGSGSTATTYTSRQRSQLQRGCRGRPLQRS